MFEPPFLDVPFFQKKTPAWAVFLYFAENILRITAVYRSFRVAKVDARWGAWFVLVELCYPRLG